MPAWRTGARMTGTEAHRLCCCLTLILGIILVRIDQVGSFSAKIPTRCIVSRPLSACLKQSASSDNGESGSSVSPGTSIRCLGSGEKAIVRPGVVLVAPAHEFHHYYRKAAIFVYTMGEDEYGVYVVRGLIIDHPTPFTLGEMMDSDSRVIGNPLSETFLFRGGDKGNDGVILLHNRDDLGQTPIGVSGIYEGGWEQALEACASGKADPDDFKVFFNYCEFTEDEIEDLLKSDEDGDAWASVEVGDDIILEGDWDRGDAWSKLRNAVAQMM